MAERGQSIVRVNVSPFLKWAGGKRWLSPAFVDQFAELHGTYREPFLGSGAVFFRHLPLKASLSDANAELIECYKAIRDDAIAVMQALEVLADRHPDEAYYEVRSMKPESIAARAARFIYLNRTCWNGLYRVNLKGDFNVPRGTKSRVLLDDDNFLAVGAALANADVQSRDFEENIDEAVAGDLIFCDPPYTTAHNLNGFIKYNQRIFSWNDQQRLAAAVKRAIVRGAIAIVTNADHQDVRELYADFQTVRSVGRASVIAAASANRRRTTELVISNTALALEQV
jgi:DNA adenine methylase